MTDIQAVIERVQVHMERLRENARLFPTDDPLASQWRQERDDIVTLAAECQRQALKIQLYSDMCDGHVRGESQLKADRDRLAADVQRLTAENATLREERDANVCVRCQSVMVK